ncbi:MAG TPA: beta-ketoacyl-[acyl-carrier-protein] synthase family protein, partial [Dehalococcoidia bacterium]|nr:beta-ketoacyl-[acyl-carrier-protein] synthase family protein [Dehalococcoidia bacterium]
MECEQSHSVIIPTCINNANSFTDSAMGEVGPLEPADNLPSFEGSLEQHTINPNHLDLKRHLNNIV